jgi:hypothetical protein
MATVALGAKKKLNGFDEVLGSDGCSGTCVYQYDSQTGQYVLQSGSCQGSGCAACASTLPFGIRELLKQAGTSVFPDPDTFSHSCLNSYEMLMERLLSQYVEYLKLQRRHRFVIALCAVLGVVAAGLLAFFLFR